MIALPWWGWGLAGIAWLTGSFAFGILIGHLLAGAGDVDREAMRQHEAFTAVFGVKR